MSVRCQRVGAVVLTYNSTGDLPDCLAGLVTQEGVDLRVIVIDNASSPEARSQMEKDFLAALPGASVLDSETALPKEIVASSGIFLRNNINGGYSAGNNIGARIAALIGCDAVLIVNPDVRIFSSTYVATLAALITADPKTAVACSAIRNLSGAHENPMAEPSLLEELLWPLKMIGVELYRGKPGPPLPVTPFKIEKASGACFLVRTDFLKKIGFFDQAVFLYCEESILRAQTRAEGYHMMMDPRLEVLHAHRSITKGDPLPRFRAWSKSRSHYHALHSGYGLISRTLLAGSRWVTLALVRGRSDLRRLRAPAPSEGAKD